MNAPYPLNKLKAKANKSCVTPLHSDSDERYSDIFQYIVNHEIEYEVVESLSLDGRLTKPSNPYYEFAQMRENGESKERIEQKRQTFINELPERPLVAFKLSDGTYLYTVGRGRSAASARHEKLGNDPLPFITYVIDATRFSDEELKTHIFETAQKSNRKTSLDVDEETTTSIQRALKIAYELASEKSEAYLDQKQFGEQWLLKNRPLYSPGDSGKATRATLIHKAFNIGHGVTLPHDEMKAEAYDKYKEVFSEPWEPENTNVKMLTNVGINGGRQGYNLNVLAYNFWENKSGNPIYWMVSLGNSNSSSTSYITEQRKNLKKVTSEANRNQGVSPVRRLCFMRQTTDLKCEFYEWSDATQEFVLVSD